MDEELNATGEDGNQDGLAIDGSAQTPEQEQAGTEDLHETQDQYVEEQAEHDGEIPPQTNDPNAIRAWIGRRDKRLKDEFDTKLKQTVETVIQGIAPLMQQQQVQHQPAQPDFNPEDLDFISDPIGSFDRLFKAKAPVFANEYVPQLTARQQSDMAAKAQAVLKGISDKARSDPDMQVDADKIIEIASKLNVDLQSKDTDTLIETVFLKAQNMALREKVTKKVNPLAANKPINQPVNGITPSPSQKQAATNVNITNELRMAAHKMGLSSDEEIIKYLTE